MRRSKIEAGKQCPKCGKAENQVKMGYNRSGTQRCMCKECGTRYTIDPKIREYPEETRELAIKMYSGVSGRGVGKVLGMSKANVYNWIKNELAVENSPDCLELDELYWFIGKKSHTETRENVYVMTAVSRNPRMILGFDVAQDKTAQWIQWMVDSAPGATRYYTDGYSGYLDVVYPKQHIFNIHNKKDTFTVKGVNADLRHYIPILARKSRCFPRKPETLYAVVEVFVAAYNRFSIAKYNYRLHHPEGEISFALVDFL